MVSNTLRSRSGQIMAVIGIVFAVTGLISLAAGSFSLVLTHGWIYFWFGYLAWLLFWNPSVKVSSQGVVVDNLFQSTSLNWSAIQRIDTKYSLTLETNFGVVRAWAAPAPSRYAGMLANRTEATNLPSSSFVGNGLIRPGDLTTSDSGVAAYVIRSHWEELRDRGQLNEAEFVTTRISYIRISCFAALSVLATLGFIL
jgi:hypothetical protein